MSSMHVLLLTAGASSRMGSPKALLPWGHGNLLDHQIKVLRKLKLPITVVTGAMSEEIIVHGNLKECQIIQNKDWEEGMGSSISVGVKHILKSSPSADGIMITLIDQPLIGFNHLNQLLVTFIQHNDKIVASSSKKIWSSPPVVFPKIYFNALIHLSGPIGAQKIVRSNRENTIRIDCGEQLQDMDTREEYNLLWKKHHQSTSS